MTTEIGLLPWVLFLGFILAMLALDLGVFNRKAHVVGYREALTWSAVWISLAMAFNVGIYFWLGKQPALEFLTGYVVEKSLSVDNIFVFVLVFTYFRVPPQYHHRVLFWGVLGALVMRALFIGAGIALITRFHWIVYIFGVFLMYTGFKMLRDTGPAIDPEHNVALKLLRRVMPVTPDYRGDSFIVKEGGRWLATPLLVTLIVVEATDLIFAVDSIPAILAITKDPFIVFTSNVFAILGLRSLYFLLAGMMDRFIYLKTGLAIILMFVGVKMTIADWYKIPIPIALTVILGVLVLSVGLSLIKTRKSGTPPPPPTP